VTGQALCRRLLQFKDARNPHVYWVFAQQDEFPGLKYTEDCDKNRQAAEPQAMIRVTEMSRAKEVVGALQLEIGH
jgi:hypothetical protein